MTSKPKDLDRLRWLAHGLSHQLQADGRPGQEPLMSRVCRLLDTRRLWLETDQAGSGAPKKLRARAERSGVGRRYLEDIRLTVQETRLALTVSRWVSEEALSYYAGSWTYHEDLQSGRFLCRFKRP